MDGHICSQLQGRFLGPVRRARRARTQHHRNSLIARQVSNKAQLLLSRLDENWTPAAFMIRLGDRYA
jgi:hypothetical protein